MADSDLVIAPNFGETFERLVAPRLPPGATLHRLSPEQGWEVSSKAQILVMAPSPVVRTPSPEPPPLGWPYNLRWLQTSSVGIDTYPPWILQVPQVTCARGLHAVAMAEFVMASILAVEKRFPDTWITSASAWKHMPQNTVKGKTLGLLGLGVIGSLIADRALAFGITVLANRRSEQPSGNFSITLASFEETVSKADYLIVTLPHTAETTRLINARTLKNVKPGVHIINVSRGAIVDQDALLAALDDGIVGFASLDVTTPEPLPDNHPLYSHPKVHLSPHTSWGGANHIEGFAELFMANLQSFMNGAELTGRVLPERGY